MQNDWPKTQKCDFIFQINRKQYNVKKESVASGPKITLFEKS